jgi:hypothetical protein
MGLAIDLIFGKTCTMLTPRKIVETIYLLALTALLAGTVHAVPTDPEISKEITDLGKLLAKEDRIYFEGKVFINRTKPEAVKESHSFSTWFFEQGKRYKTFYDDGKVQHNSVWDGETCMTWHSENGKSTIGTKTSEPSWDINPSSMITPSDYILDGLNGYQGLLKMFEFSNRQERAHIRIFDIHPSDAHAQKGQIPEDAVMRLLFDSRTGLIVAIYQELPGKMIGSTKVLNHWFTGESADVLRAPVNVNFE